MGMGNIDQCIEVLVLIIEKYIYKYYYLKEVFTYLFIFNLRGLGFM